MPLTFQSVVSSSGQRSLGLLMVLAAQCIIPRVAMVKGEIPEHRLSAVYEPMINLILTGSKSMTTRENKPK